MTRTMTVGVAALTLAGIHRRRPSIRSLFLAHRNPVPNVGESQVKPADHVRVQGLAVLGRGPPRECLLRNQQYLSKRALTAPNVGVDQPPANGSYGQRAATLNDLRLRRSLTVLEDRTGHRRNRTARRQGGGQSNRHTGRKSDGTPPVRGS